MSNAADLPRITIPQKMIENIEKKRIKRETENRKKNIKFTSPTIISCKRNEFDHHKGQKYNEFSPKALASHGWKHRESAGDYFTINCHQRNPALQKETGRLYFTDFDLNEDLIRQLESMNIECPTIIQRNAIPVILSGESVQMSAETGSGKTLAYLLPIMEMVNRQKKEEAKTGYRLPDYCPRCIILAPTKELLNQVKSVADRFSELLDLRVELLSGNNRRKMRHGPIDIILSTPTIVSRALSLNIIKPSHAQYIVLDEADTLLDDSFNSNVQSFINKLGVSEVMSTDAKSAGGMQLILVSATLPRSLDSILGNQFSVESMKKVSTDHVHHLMPHVPQKFIKLKPSQKPEEIMKLARTMIKKGSPGMIFCNNMSTSVWLSKFLKEQSIDNVLMNSKLTSQERQQLFQSFKNEENDILVCTDIASRGLDTTWVQHVVNYEFPDFMSDYIHRAGRVGRVSSKNNGQVTSFVTYNWEVDLLWHIERAARKSQELHNVNANIKRKLVSRSTNEDIE